ncbi:MULTISPECIES: hypothetical protein [unclassified Bradyrhizobium]|jgi:hypothetical protein|uniref:hypothetical protein n=1 Tax=unclassified Bradyrhizobium TaxID=2631580 RepID=UPI0010511751|nr:MULTISPECIES: hypothetical protein [unclassified Bradyrhizobium]
MRKIAYGLAAAALFAGTQFPVPANAMTALSVGAAAASEMMQAGYYHRRRYHRRVCTVRTVIKRGYHGRRIIKHMRVCR